MQNYSIQVHHFLAIFKRGTTFLTPSLLSWVTLPFRKGVHKKKMPWEEEKLLPWEEIHFFEIPILEGIHHPGRQTGSYKRCSPV